MAFVKVTTNDKTNPIINTDQIICIAHASGGQCAIKTSDGKEIWALGSPDSILQSFQHGTVVA